ncbi:MAG: hypothetical protein AAGC96_10820 [Pseudomonadota bacterium]
MSRATQIAATMCMSLVTLGTASAADAVVYEPVPVAAPVDEWIITTTPYFWATIYDGSLTINGIEADLSGTTVFDLLSDGDVNFPPLVNYFEARKGRWGGYLDTTFIGLNFTDEFSISQPPATLGTDLDFTYILVNAGVIYTAAEWTSGTSNTALDLLGGVRYTYYDIDLDVSPVGLSTNATLDWWDITLGARLRANYDNGWYWNIRGDLAGADLESDFSAQAIAVFGRDFSLGRVDMSWMAGYRYLYQDWSDGDNAVDLTTHGPLVGLTIKF